MNPEAADFWARALQAFKTANHNTAIDPDAAASRAYYAAFYGVSALFALENRTFSRHSALETAVHRDLVNSGRWPAALYRMQQVAPVVTEEPDRFVVITVYTFYFQEGGKQ